MGINKSAKVDKKPWEFQDPIIINRLWSNIYENCLTQELQKLRKTERALGLLDSVSLIGIQKNSTKRLSHFIPLKHQYHRYYIDPT